MTTPTPADFKQAHDISMPIGQCANAGGGNHSEFCASIAQALADKYEAAIKECIVAAGRIEIGIRAYEKETGIESMGGLLKIFGATEAQDCIRYLLPDPHPESYATKYAEPQEAVE